jgi:hypothetical protein
VPVGGRVAYFRLEFCRPAAPPSRRRRARVDSPKLFVERADRLFAQNRHDRLEALELAGMQIDGVAARRQRRVLETLEVPAHVRDDGLDDVARLAARRCGDGIHDLNGSG